MNKPHLPLKSSQKSDKLVIFWRKIVQSFLSILRGLTDEDARALLAAYGFYDFELDHLRNNQPVHRDPALDEMVEQIEFPWPEELGLKTYTLQTPGPFSYLHAGERQTITIMERRTSRMPRKVIRRWGSRV